jgi:hypothetical protein
MPELRVNSGTRPERQNEPEPRKPDVLFPVPSGRAGCLSVAGSRIPDSRVAFARVRRSSSFGSDLTSAKVRRDADLRVLDRLRVNRTDAANSRFVMTGSQFRVLLRRKTFAGRSATWLHNGLLPCELKNDGQTVFQIDVVIKPCFDFGGNTFSVWRIRYSLAVTLRTPAKAIQLTLTPICISRWLDVLPHQVNRPPI